MAECPATPRSFSDVEGLRTPSPSSRVEDKVGGASLGDRDSPPPEEQCAICLGRIENKSHTDCCKHMFCFTCLREWGEHNNVCPLCKTTFKAIIHTIKANDDFLTFTLPERPPPPPRPVGDIEVVDFAGRPITNPAVSRMLHSRMISYMELQEFEMILQNPWLNELRRFPVQAQRDLLTNNYLAVPPRDELFRNRAERRRLASSEFRRSIYDRGLYILPDSVADITGRQRESGPDWYRNNPAQTHRLVPWLNRELNAITTVAPHQLPHVLQRVMDLIEQYSINSQEFRIAMEPYIGVRTSHFQHEFHSFATSVYDMIGYDRVAEYEVGQAQRPVETLVLSSEEEEVPSTSTAAVTAVVPQQAIEIESSDEDDVVLVDEVQMPKKAPEVIDIDSSPERLRRRQREPSSASPGPSWKGKGKGKKSIENELKDGASKHRKSLASDKCSDNASDQCSDKKSDKCSDNDSDSRARKKVKVKKRKRRHISSNSSRSSSSDFDFVKFKQSVRQKKMSSDSSIEISKRRNCLMTSSDDSDVIKKKKCKSSSKVKKSFKRETSSERIVRMIDPEDQPLSCLRKRTELIKDEVENQPGTSRRVVFVDSSSPKHKKKKHRKKKSEKVSDEDCQSKSRSNQNDEDLRVALNRKRAAHQQMPSFCF